MNLHTALLSSPIGTLEIKGNEDGIYSVYFINAPPSSSCVEEDNTQPSLINCMEQLKEYFAGTRKVFELKLNPKGTEFRNRVWKELARIPFGRTSTYLEISKQLGDALATRAVGNANGSNPVSIIIPCHRVIGVDGSLVGYSGGLWRKQWLLNHEASIMWGKQEKLF